jgi:hypothetical protein
MVKKIKMPVIIKAIGINPFLFAAISKSSEVNTLKVSLMAPIENNAKNIAGILYRFILFI